jgi:hypothetical protein
VTDWQGRISFDPSVCLKAPCTKGLTSMFGASSVALQTAIPLTMFSRLTLT